MAELVHDTLKRGSLTQFIHHNSGLPQSQQVDKEYQDDAVWIISSSFLIFTMHSGFGLLESGNVSAKDEVNIMVKNVVDVVCGGLAYWAVGFGLSFGADGWMDNPIIGFGQFFYDPGRMGGPVDDEAWAYAVFLFQMSLATTASTIVSGAVAERAKLKSYILLGILVTLAQALPAHWVWDKRGFFNILGVVDYAGCSCNHLVGGIIGLVATVYLKPRRNRFIEDSVHQMSSPGNALLGTFLLWWGWFGINTGCVWGVSGGRWRLGGRCDVGPRYEYGKRTNISRHENGDRSIDIGHPLVKLRESVDLQHSRQSICLHLLSRAHNDSDFWSNAVFGVTRMPLLVCLKDVKQVAWSFFWTVKGPLIQYLPQVFVSDEPIEELDMLGKSLEAAREVHLFLNNYQQVDLKLLYEKMIEHGLEYYYTPIDVTYNMIMPRIEQSFQGKRFSSFAKLKATIAEALLDLSPSFWRRASNWIKQECLAVIHFTGGY